VTYTFATLEVSKAAYDEIRAKLIEAGYDHAIRQDRGDVETVDMNGIALVRDNPPSDRRFTPGRDS
jgi:hypothetical protein